MFTVKLLNSLYLLRLFPLWGIQGNSRKHVHGMVQKTLYFDLSKGNRQHLFSLVAFLFDESTLLGAFATIASAIFIAELTDKDALLLLALATKIKPWTAFAAGSTAFAITTAIIVSIGYVLTSVFPVFWIKLLGGIIMICYAIYQYATTSKEKEQNEISKEEKRIEESKKRSRAFLRLFFGIVSMLAILDLAGDVTEVLTIVFVARFQNPLLVFISCVVALSAASAVETTIGNRLGKLFSFERIRIFSLLVFLIIGAIVILTTIVFG
jgi:putative Ca2+/H+ antiporter (TMEM165/GDT1 family)